MGCLNTKPKLKPQTVVVHSCDYHTDHRNGIIHRLKSRSPSPSRYVATQTTRIVAVNNERDEHGDKLVRHKPRARPRSSSTQTSIPSLPISLPSTPEAERSTLNVMDAEDLVPAEYNLTKDPDAGTKTRLSDEKSQATLTKIAMKPASSARTSQAMNSNQSLLSSQDTLKVEDLDSDMDEFSRMSTAQPAHEPHRTATPAPTSILLPLRKQKQEKENESPKLHRPDDKTANDKIKHTKIKAFKAPKEKKKTKEKVKLEKVKELSKENFLESKWIEHNKETGEIKIHFGQNILSKSVEDMSVNNETKSKKESTKETLNMKHDIEKHETETKQSMESVKSLKSKQDKQKANKKIKNEDDSLKLLEEEDDFMDKTPSTVQTGNKTVVCEAVETKAGISLEYKETENRDDRMIINCPSDSLSNMNASNEFRVTSPLPKDLYQKELERVRLNRKRKRRAQKRNPDYTPRVPKQSDTEAMAYLGSDVIFKSKLKPAHSTIASNLSSTENLTVFGSESRLSGTSDLSSLDKSNELLPDGVIFRDETLTGEVDLYSLDSLDDRNTRFFSEKNSLMLGDLSHQYGIPSGPSTSDINTKQKLLYSKYERRPYSESVLRLAGRPPLPPDTSSNANRPVSEKVRRAQTYSRYFTPDLDLT